MASYLLSVMHWNNIGTGLELRHMGCLIKRGFQVFLLQSLSSSFRYIRDHLIHRMEGAVYADDRHDLLNRFNL